MRISHLRLSTCVLALFFCLGLPAVHAQVEYGTSAAAGAFADVFADADSDLNLAGTLAVAQAELIGVVAGARADMNKVSGRSAITDIADSDAFTYDTFSWDTFDVTSSSIPNGTATTVTFVIGLDADLRASYGDPGAGSPPYATSLMIVDVYTVTPTADVPTAIAPVFVGTAVLDATSGLSMGAPPNDLTSGDFSVQAVSGGYTATLTGFQTPIDIATTVGSQISLRFSVQTGASVAPDVTGGIAIADLQDSLQLLEIQTEAGVDVSRASGAPIPPVPLHAAPVLVVMLPTVGALWLRKRSRTARGLAA